MEFEYFKQFYLSNTLSLSLFLHTQEFSCQEVRENFDDLVLFFPTHSEMQRFLAMLESLWLQKMVIDLFLSPLLLALSHSDIRFMNY